MSVLLLCRPVQNGFDEIAKLLRAKLVSFQICSKIAIAIDDNRMEGMREKSLVAPEIHSKALRDFADFW